MKTGRNDLIQALEGYFSTGISTSSIHNWGQCGDGVIGCDGCAYQIGRGCDLIRLVRSVTWLNRLRRSAINWRILRSACITVV